MTLSKYLARFGRIMVNAGHDSSWGTTKATVNGEETVTFVFVTHDRKRGEAAMRVLGRAGLLCETPLSREGEPAPTTSDTVQCLVEGLRHFA